MRGFEDIIAQIQDAVFHQRLQAGDKLPNERELCTLFGVSRPTVREAFRVLETQGIIEVRRGPTGGAFIAEPTGQSASGGLAAMIRFRGATVEELAEFRRTFEPETAAWAARRATPAQHRQLFALADQFGATGAQPDVPWSRLVKVDIAFHLEVAEASHNQIRVAIMLAIHGIFEQMSQSIAAVERPSWRAEQTTQLRAVADAIAAGDSNRARQAMRHHVVNNVSVELLAHARQHMGDPGP